MNQQFRDTVTSAAFHLTLSTRQVEYLMLAAAEVGVHHTSVCVGTYWQLVRKGLLECRCADGQLAFSSEEMIARGGREGGRPLTRAGELMLGLLVEAGYSVDAEIEEAPGIGDISRVVRLHRRA